jgi:hypothetical protein
VANRTLRRVGNRSDDPQPVESVAVIATVARPLKRLCAESVSYPHQLPSLGIRAYGETGFIYHFRPTDWP